MGCGRVYKKGYVNVDAYDDIVADEIQDAADLRYQDNSVERIDACQVIEHLGFAKSIYALSEWFRVLKPSGCLLVETPDIEAAFRLFTKAGEKDKSDLLVWIYGLGSIGMRHIFCFPRNLIVDLLRKTGFENIRQESFTVEKNRPTLRVTSIKPERYWPLQFMASFRKNLNRECAIDVSNENETLDLENSIDFLTSKMVEHNSLGDITEIEAAEVAVELGVYSPRVALCLIGLLQRFPNLHEVFTEIEKAGFTGKMVRVFKTMPVMPGKQKETFRLVRDMGKQALYKAISSKGKSILDTLSGESTQSREAAGEEEAGSFSEEVLKRLSDRLFCQGGKEFNLGNKENALERFRNSILLFRDNIMSYINIARLMRLSGNDKQAEEEYRNAIKLLGIFNYGGNTNLRKAIEKERQNQEGIGEPLLSLGDLGH